MPNFVTHIAEIASDGLTSEEKKATIDVFGQHLELNNKSYVIFQERWHFNTDFFSEVSKVFNGKTFKAYIFDEDPGNLVGEGTITSNEKQIPEQIEWSVNFSKEAYSKHARFSKLENELNEIVNEHKRVREEQMRLEMGSLDDMYERKLDNDVEQHSENISKSNSTVKTQEYLLNGKFNSGLDKEFFSNPMPKAQGGR